MTEIKLELLSVVVSVYNEEDGLPAFWLEMKKHLDGLQVQPEILFVNDGSTDSTAHILNALAKQDERVRAIHLSRNFGHEAAMIAGLDHSHGDLIICMDADLQHPPERIADLLAKYREGYEIVNMVRREDHNGRSFNKLSSLYFYKFINLISPVDFAPNASDFFMVSRRIKNLLHNEYRERTRFLRGFIQIIGFKKTIVEFTAPKRTKGNSKYTLVRLIRFSFATVITFSKMPIHFAMLFGAFCGIGSILYGIFEIIVKLLGYSLPGYATIVALITFFFSVQIFTIGIIGEYIGYLFLESKQRPIYIVDQVVRQNETITTYLNPEQDGPRS